MSGRRAVIAVFALVLALAATGCGDDDDSGGTSDAGGTDAAAEFQDRLDEYYGGTFEDPSGPPVKPTADEEIWVVVSGLSAESPQNFASAIEEAGNELGWTVRVVDGKFDPTAQLRGVEQAVAAGADGIITTYIDCATIKTALEEAKDQDIPTVANEGRDCNPSLFTHGLIYVDDEDFIEWTRDWAGLQAVIAIAKTDGQAKTVVDTQTDIYSLVVGSEAWDAEFAECPDCEIVADAEFVGAEYGGPLQQKLEQAFVQNPDANSYIAAYDAILTSGGNAAVKGSGLDLVVVGGECTIPVVKMVHAGEVDGCSGTDAAANAWGAVDAMARILAGEDPSEANTGIGVQAVDAEHNLPPEGEGFTSPVDYKAAYLDMWGLG